MAYAGIDFFDVDHTILRSSSARHFAIFGVKRGVFPLRALFFIPVYYLYYRYGSINTDSFQRLFPLFRGIPREQLVEISSLSFHEKLKDDIFVEAISLIEHLKRTGRMVVLATSSLDLIVEPLADHLGIDAVIASSLEFEGPNELCTGHFTSPPIFELEKKKRVMEFIESRALQPESCSFYSDSIHDLPLLESVGSPVVVNPDPRLRRVAEGKGWHVMSFSG